MDHHCHALGCNTPCKPEMLMCYKHWKMVPDMLQREAWRTYRVGQCDDKNPSPEWHLAADRAIYAVAYKEGRVLKPFDQWSSWVKRIDNPCHRKTLSVTTAYIISADDDCVIDLTDHNNWGKGT